ncbi:hypothetical protein [Helicobacter sp. MIT 05-5294]|uniref:hypothetical protein n=1 Tax=Helicobacter sp. MIT 05-5294 TaxID=1548150 RepID=UPI0010FD7153|nr:hypothetical protein [Helicobacter sp. MIT 05-5294]TLD85412.1 hypothetical protein LS69_009675 [Helicobacter sp. MIT 05-5294]
MTKLKVIYGLGYPIFLYKHSSETGYRSNKALDRFCNNDKGQCFEMDLFLDYLRYTTKSDILLSFEYLFLGLIDDKFFARNEVDSITIQAYHIDHLDNNLSPNPPRPTYISEYINVIGQLFLAGYIDFGSYCDDEDRNRIDYPTNLSYYKEDKYQAWIHFRDNYFYANRFNRDLDEPDTIDEKGYSLILGDTSWDTPKYWSQYNIWVARTPKGTKYFNEILAPRFYNKYKDLEVEIDEKGNIIRWIGEINR